MSKLTVSKLLSRCRRAIARWLGPQPLRDPGVQRIIDDNPWLAWLDRWLNPARRGGRH